MADDTGDRDWLARRYLLGGLDPAEAEAFEAGLEHDEEGAAALAAAFRLLAAVEGARPEVTVVPAMPVTAAASSAGRSATLAGRGAAVGILATAVAVGGLLLVRNPDPGRGGVPDAAGTAREVAVVTEAEVEEPADTDDVPGWLLTAVALEAEGAAGVREN